jgi:hypothetical protein
MFPVLSRQYGMLSMIGIRCHKENSFHVIPLDDILKALLLIASVLLAEGLPLLRRSRIASYQSCFFAPLDGTADDGSPASNTDERHPYLVLFCHEPFLLFEDFSTPVSGSENTNRLFYSMEPFFSNDLSPV